MAESGVAPAPKQLEAADGDAPRESAPLTLVEHALE
jgi:hypothetical protein